MKYLEFVILFFVQIFLIFLKKIRDNLIMKSNMLFTKMIELNKYKIYQIASFYMETIC